MTRQKLPSELQNDHDLVPPRQPMFEITEADLPDADLMEKMDVPLKDFADFVKATKLLVLVGQGMTITKAADQVGVSRRSVYEDRWQELIRKAKRLMFGRAMMAVAAAETRVLEEWPTLINTMIAKIKAPGVELKDMSAAMEFLYMAYAANAKEAVVDDNAEREYLSAGQSFNPLGFIQVQDGGSLTINMPEPQPTLRAGGEYIDVTPISDED